MDNRDIRQHMSDATLGEAREATELVMTYLRSRHAWEVESKGTYRRAENDGTLMSGLDAIRRSYETLLVRFCTPAVVERPPRFSFRDPPSVEPAKTKVRAVRRDGKRLVVVTSEKPKSAPEPRDVEYVLEPIGDRLLIADRRVKDYDGRWIRRVL